MCFVLVLIINFFIRKKKLHFLVNSTGCKIAKKMKNGKVSAWREKFSNKFNTKFSQIEIVII